VHVTGYVDDETLVSLYRRAVAFAYPSLDEGFGLPVLEAMACGCPVLTSDVPVLREVAGGAADLIDPLDVASIAAGLEVLVTDDARRASLVERGFARAAQFSWARTAAGVEEVIASVM
jgi:glycosyltransferase involved in cell wall biosynthesis